MWLILRVRHFLFVGEEIISLRCKGEGYNGIGVFL